MPRKRAQFRIRSLHPNLLSSERFSGLSDFAEVLFLRLHLGADDEGRMVGDLGLLKAWLFPLRARTTAEQIDAGLDELQEASLVVRYSDGKRRLLAIVDFVEFQKPRHPWPSDYPPPSSADGMPRLAGTTTESGVSAGQGLGGVSPHVAVMRSMEVEMEVDVENPLTPAQRGNTSLRSRGENPRAKGTNPRADAVTEAVSPIDACELCTDQGWVIARYPDEFIRCAHQATPTEVHRVYRDPSQSEREATT